MTIGGARTSVIEVRNVVKHYAVRQGAMTRSFEVVRAVDGVSLEIGAGESVGLVGESGCGKSTLARMVLRLEPPSGGQLLFRGKDYSKLSKRETADFRSSVQAVFQDPYSSLNPRMRVGDIVGEPLRSISGVSREVARGRAREILNRVGMPTDSAEGFPHQFSGGQRQRIAIARALISDPSVIVLDEPTSSLDVSIRAQILNLLNRLRGEFNVSFLAISHDLSMIRHLCDRVAVMYLGRVVETSSNEHFYENPLHPYAQGLLQSLLSPSSADTGTSDPIPGEPPSPVNPPPGCSFHPRCRRSFELCPVELPVLEHRVGCEADQLTACHLYESRTPLQVMGQGDVA